MKIFASLLLLILLSRPALAQAGFADVTVESNITDVQPMTGIVFWTTSPHNNSDAIRLEYSYMLYDQVVQAQGQYDWTVVDDLLDAVASRGHQAILRFRYTYVGYETAVPQYIKDLPDYQETEGISEGQTTWFPDWSHPELKAFTLDFYTQFAERYDNDPRIAFLQTGFGLWAEYHIYDGPFELGVTFPDKAFQTTFLQHMDSVFIHLPWNISIDAADDTYAPFDIHPELLNLDFGNFDDSFMSVNHQWENEVNWNFFGAERYKTNPAGGEFSYYTIYDQQHVLDWPDGPYGKPYEDFAKKFQITYMIGNDQPDYQPMSRIKEAGLASGYKFWVKSFKTAPDSSIIEIQNVGVAPIYYDAYPTVNGVRADESLKYLASGESKFFHISAGGANPGLTIECDRLVPGQKIDYYGTTYVPIATNEPTYKHVAVYPSPASAGTPLSLDLPQGASSAVIRLFTANGQRLTPEIMNGKVLTDNLKKGVYFIKITTGDFTGIGKFIIQ